MKEARAIKVEIEREADGRWIAEVPDLPGVMSYGKTRKEAVARAKALALRLLADRLEHGEIQASERKLVIRRAGTARQGWDEAYRRMAQAGDDALLDEPTGTE